MTFFGKLLNLWFKSLRNTLPSLNYTGTHLTQGKMYTDNTAISMSPSDKFIREH